MKELAAGDKAPRFSLTDKEGATHQFKPGDAAFTVIYFYPKDNTPGCTIEASEFSALLKKFKARDVIVYGISGGTDKTKASFCLKHKLTVTLLSDTDFSVATAYGAYGPKKFMGRTFDGIHRKTFIVDKRGVVVQVFDSVKAKGHAEEVLSVIDRLRKA